MSRRRRRKHLLHEVADSPWPVGVGVAAAVWALTSLGPRLLVSDQPLLVPVANEVARYAPLFASPFLIAAGVSWWRSRSRGRDRRRLLERHTDLDAIRALPWERFEHLVGEAYRRRGHAVRENRSAGPDGGIDLVLERGGERVLVQCKRWRADVGVAVVRELLGAVVAAGASRGIVVTTAGFTRPAREFAAANRIELVDGEALVRLVGEVARDAPAPDSPPTASIEPAIDPPSGGVHAGAPEPRAPPGPRCSRCGGSMVRRTARRGRNAGHAFLGCAGSPACRGTLPLA